MDRSVIEKYAAGGPVPGKAIAGLSREELNSVPVPGTWSIQQIVMHLMDSDLISGDRMKRIIAEDNPLILSYDETRFAERLHYPSMDPVLACELFERNRAMITSLLRALPDDVFARTGVHSQRGKITLEQLVHTYVDHLDHHMKFLLQKRRMLGK